MTEWMRGLGNKNIAKHQRKTTAKQIFHNEIEKNCYENDTILLLLCGPVRALYSGTFEMKSKGTHLFHLSFSNRGKIET